MDKVFVAWQAFAVPVAVLIVGLICGHRIALALVIATGCGTLIWVALAVVHTVRTHGKPGHEPNERAWAFAMGVIGLVVPTGLAAGLLATSHFDGLVFKSEASVFAGVALVVIWLTILVSSLFDRYLILPFCYGQLGPPIWSVGLKLPGRRRRRFAQIWVGHRAVCEVCAYTALAMLLAIVFVALGSTVSHEHILAVALESLGGTGVAIAILAYAGPRVRDGWSYMIANNAGLGSWACGIIGGETVEGLVVDVSLSPGVKLRTKDDQWQFVSLEDARNLHELEDRRPAQCNETWAKEAVLTRGEAKVHEPPSKPQTDRIQHPTRDPGLVPND